MTGIIDDLSQAIAAQDREIARKDTEIERLKADAAKWQELGSQGIQIERELRFEIERLREIIRDALDDEVALRMMPKWCEDARAALKPKP